MVMRTMILEVFMFVSDFIGRVTMCVDMFM